MAYIPKSDPLWQELSSIAADEGVRLYDLERFGVSGLRVYICGGESTPAETKQVTSGDCSKLCKRLMTFFTVEGPTYGLGTEPEIEVSSPGINRHLRLWDHFVGAVGERVRFGIRGDAIAEDGSESVQVGGLLGKLEEANEESLRVRDEKTQRAWKINFNQVARAAVEFEFKSNS